MLYSLLRSKALIKCHRHIHHFSAKVVARTLVEDKRMLIAFQRRFRRI